jgi:hypothetical protein
MANSGIKKRFDPTLYAQNDEIARNFVKNVLKGSDYQVMDNPKKRGVDLLVYKDSIHIANIECEIKRVWKTTEFPYDSVQIPERKEKYTGLDKPTIFVMLNSDQTQYLAVKDTTLLASPKKEVPNKYVFKGELFFQVPKDQVIFNDLLEVLEEVEDGL